MMPNISKIALVWITLVACNNQESPTLSAEAPAATDENSLASESGLGLALPDDIVADKSALYSAKIQAFNCGSEAKDAGLEIASSGSLGVCDGPLVFEKSYNDLRRYLVIPASVLTDGRYSVVLTIYKAGVEHLKGTGVTSMIAGSGYVQVDLLPAGLVVNAQLGKPSQPSEE